MSLFRHSCKNAKSETRNLETIWKVEPDWKKCLSCDGENNWEEVDRHKTCSAIKCNNIIDDDGKRLCHRVDQFQFNSDVWNHALDTHKFAFQPTCIPCFPIPFGEDTGRPLDSQGQSGEIFSNISVPSWKLEQSGEILGAMQVPILNDNLNNFKLVEDGKWTSAKTATTSIPSTSVIATSITSTTTSKATKKVLKDAKIQESYSKQTLSEATPHQARDYKTLHGDRFRQPLPNSRSSEKTNISALAWNSAFNGAIAGFLATMLQVICFMWLRTAINYQHFHGCDFRTAMRELYREGRLPRLYQGVSLAILQSPLAKAGMTAANAGVPILLESYMPTASEAMVTAISSACAAVWKVAVMPIEVIKTMRQVKGDDANAELWLRLKELGLGAFYVGAPVTFLLSFVGTYPFLLAFNLLNAAVPDTERTCPRIIRNGIIGMFASGASDTCTNFLKVLKTNQQCSQEKKLGVAIAVKRIIDSDGIIGVF